MRLVIATPLYPPEIGGPATYAQVLMQGLPALGIEVEVVKFADVRHLPKLIRHYAYYRHLYRAARSADLVLALDPVSVGLPAMKAAKRAGKPFIVKIVGDYAWEQGKQRFGIKADLDEFIKMERVPPRVRMFQRIQARVARAAEQVIVPSQYLKRVITTWGIPSAKIVVIYNAVPAETPGVIPEAMIRLPRPLVLTAGRLVPWKNINGVIDAIANLRATGAKASLVVAGDGPEGAQLVTYAEQKLKDNFLFTGALSHADMLATLQSANAFILNSSYEGLSHFLIEALMLGVPTIATAAGGNPEIITNNQDGLLVPVNGTASLSEALARIFQDTEFSARLSATAKESSRRFSENTMLSSTAALFKALV